MWPIFIFHTTLVVHKFWWLYVIKVKLYSFKNQIIFGILLRNTKNKKVHEFEEPYLDAHSLFA
jgi:hypothetical protein